MGVICSSVGEFLPRTIRTGCYRGHYGAATAVLHGCNNLQQGLAVRYNAAAETCILGGRMAPLFSGSNEWGRRFDDVIDRIQRRMPAGVAPDEIEAHITAARAEVRQARQARRASIRGGEATPNGPPPPLP